MLNECEQLWASRAAQALDARLANHVVAPSVNPILDLRNEWDYAWLAAGIVGWCADSVVC